MAKIFSGERIVPVWLAAVNGLAANKREGRNFILEISDPTRITPADREVIAIVDGALRVGSNTSVKTVAGTIFPQATYARYGPSGRPAFYQEFKTRMVRAKKKNTWGTYALRIMERRAVNPKETVNPLEQIINKLNRAAHGGQPFKAVYELGVVEPAEDLDSLDAFGCELPTFDVKIDGNIVRGGPCLSHLSFKLTDCKQVDLTAIYRYHYYCQRTLGNLVGLSQLLLFVAKESSLKVGTLTCISTQAALDLKSWSKSTETSIKKIEEINAANVD